MFLIQLVSHSRFQVGYISSVSSKERKKRKKGKQRTGPGVNSSETTLHCTIGRQGNMLIARLLSPPCFNGESEKLFPPSSNKTV